MIADAEEPRGRAADPKAIARLDADEALARRRRQVCVPVHLRIRQTDEDRMKRRAAIAGEIYVILERVAVRVIRRPAQGDVLLSRKTIATCRTQHRQRGRIGAYRLAPHGAAIVANLESLRRVGVGPARAEDADALPIAMGLCKVYMEWSLGRQWRAVQDL